MILLIHHGFINAGPPSSQIPLPDPDQDHQYYHWHLDHTFITCRSNLFIHWSRLFIKYPQEIMMLKSTWNIQQNSEKYLIALIKHDRKNCLYRNMLLSDFIINNFSHEFKTPDCLYGSSSWIRIIKIRPTWPRRSSAKEYLTLRYKESRCLSELSPRLILDLSRIESLSSLPDRHFP